MLTWAEIKIGHWWRRIFEHCAPNLFSLKQKNQLPITRGSNIPLSQIFWLVGGRGRGRVRKESCYRVSSLGVSEWPKCHVGLVKDIPSQVIPLQSWRYFCLVLEVSLPLIQVQEPPKDNWLRMSSNMWDKFENYLKKDLILFRLLLLLLVVDESPNVNSQISQLLFLGIRKIRMQWWRSAMCCWWRSFSFTFWRKMNKFIVCWKFVPPPPPSSPVVACWPSSSSLSSFKGSMNFR